MGAWDEMAQSSISWRCVLAGERGSSRAVCSNGRARMMLAARDGAPSDATARQRPRRLLDGGPRRERIRSVPCFSASAATGA